MIDTLVLLGASGDLTSRFLLPALASLQAAGRLPDRFTVVGAATADWDDATFRRHADEHLGRHADDLPAAGLPRGSRIALEKPFGEDLAGARDLNALLDRVTGEAGEAAVFRVDHVLGMASVANLVALRANPLLQAGWNSTVVEEVAVLWEETLALEGRAGYYDGTGALKDVVQNHLLQVLALVAMDVPQEPGERALRDAKVAALRSLRPLGTDEVADRTCRARYTAGRLADSGGADGGEVPDYAAEEGVDPARGTETYAEVVLESDVDRWSGTRFVLRAGKALATRRKGVLLRFRPAGAATVPGSLWIGLDGPDDLVLELAGRADDGADGRSEPVPLTGQPPAAQFPAYARVLFDVLDGGSALSVRGDEAEEQWRIVAPISEAWAADSPPLLDYPAGTSGPERPFGRPAEGENDTSVPTSTAGRGTMRRPRLTP